MSRGLLVMAYGSPASIGDIGSYYTHIRRGRPPTEEQLANLVSRYEAIGGTAALAERTAEQVRALEAGLDRAGEPSAGAGNEWVVALGTKHAEPDIAQGVARLLQAGARTIVGLVLAPHFSAASVGEYHRRAAAAIEAADTAARGITYTRIDSWHTLEALLAFQADQIRSALGALPERTKVVFTAHSLPERVLTGDPYPDQLHESAAATARLAGLPRWAGWGLGWQSAGATAEPWRGPDLLEIIADLAETGRSEAILVVPQGFTSEHLEVLYDIDIEAAAAAEQAGLALARTSVINDDPGVMAALADLVEQTAGVGRNR